MALLRRRRANGRKPGADPDATTIFFATDLHGSETCFRKFVAAAGFYGADLLVLGGDLTGKLVVPLVAQPGGRWRAWVHGRERLLDEAGVAELERQARVAGSYTRRMDPDEHARLARINVRACQTCHVPNFCAECHNDPAARYR